jgi:hypothetical protein
LHDEEKTKDGPRSGTWSRYSFPQPFFCAKVRGRKTDQQKSCPSTVWAFRPKKGEFFFARFSAPHFGNRRRRRTSRVAFSFGYFSFGEAKEKYLARRGETRLATGDHKPINTAKLIAN